MYNNIIMICCLRERKVNNMKQQINKVTALYCRLSHEDELRGDSMSIQNQRDLLTRYANEHGYTNIKVFADDGYTGTNFNRPAFQEMLTDIEDEKIGTVIVKDLSRLGREYLQTGYYTEIFFPQRNVHFIAVNDGVDSDLGYNDFAPFKNIINEFYAKDASVKIKAVLHNKAARGDCASGRPPYGYDKDATGKRLVPNENADNVREMFQLALLGHTCYQIANLFTKRGILSPWASYYERMGKTDSKYYPEFPTLWTKCTVKCILTNPVYTGGTYALKTKGISFKNRKQVPCPKDEWIITENTHEALVSKEDFNTVSERVSVKSRDFELNPENIFRGLLICADCGSRLAMYNYKTKNFGKRLVYKCDKFSRIGKRGCSIHYIRFDDIYEVVLSDIQRHVSLAAENRNKYINMLITASNESGSNNRNSLNKELASAQSRVKELSKILQKLYEDNALGKLSDERYHDMSGSMEQEYSSLKSRIAEISDVLSQTEKATKNAAEFADLVEKYADIKELDSDLIHTLIDKIVVHEKDVVDGDTTQRIDIYYRFIGNTSLKNDTAARI